MLCRICIVQIDPTKRALDHMRVIRLPLGNMSYIIQIRNVPALRDLDHEVGSDDLHEVCEKQNRPLYIIRPGPTSKT